MTTEDQVNEVITFHLSALYNIDELRGRCDGEILQIVDDIAEYATNGVLLVSEDDSLNHGETKAGLALKYPYLTEASRIKMADVAAYFWK